MFGHIIFNRYYQKLEVLVTANPRLIIDQRCLDPPAVLLFYDPYNGGISFTDGFGVVAFV